MRIIGIIAGIIVVGMCVAAGATIIRDKSWEGHIMEVLLCFVGAVAFFFADEWTGWTGRYGMTRSDYRITPEWFIRIIGFLMAVVSSLFVLSGKHYE